MGPPPVLADLQDECRVTCRPTCDGFSSDVCNTVTDIAPILKTLNFFFTTCKVIKGFRAVLGTLRQHLQPQHPDARHTHTGAGKRRRATTVQAMMLDPRM
jgi:hypothetical protein